MNYYSLLLCMIFFILVHIAVFYLAFLSIGSHIVFISILGLQVTVTQHMFAQSAETVEYTDCFSAEGKDPPPSQCWSFGEYGVLLHCHHSQIHSGPEW